MKPTLITKYKTTLLRNKFLLMLVLGLLIYGFFIDQNSFFQQSNLREELDELRTAKEFYQEEIKNNKEQIKQLSSREYLEKFAREKYHMVKDGETLYLLELEE